MSHERLHAERPSHFVVWANCITYDKLDIRHDEVKLFRLLSLSHSKVNSSKAFTSKAILKIWIPMKLIYDSRNSLIAMDAVTAIQISSLHLLHSLFYTGADNYTTMSHATVALFN